MCLNAAPPAPIGKPNLLELAQLIIFTGLLPSTLVPLLPLTQLKRRIREINLTHPQYQEETLLILACEAKRRGRLNGQLQMSTNQSQVV